MADAVSLTVHHGDEKTVLAVERGSNLRRVLLDAGLSPYGSVSRHANCGGRGLCSTCGVEVLTDQPAPRQWHDRLAVAWGYPRLSCQVSVEEPMAVRLLDGKVVWGQVLPRRGRYD
jgi:ferredoxin